MRRSSSRLPIPFVAAIVSLAVSLMTASVGFSQIQVVNIVPAWRSNETGIDSEPNLAVDPANPLRMAASAFTFDSMSDSNAPIYVSTDGGATWTLNSILPGESPDFATHDVTLRFGGTSGILYVGILRGDAAFRLNILRAADFTAGTPMTLLVSRDHVDQPYVAAATVMGGPSAGTDRVYIGNNNGIGGVGTTPMATIDRSLDAAATPAPGGFTPLLLETRPSLEGDGPAIRPAIHPDGTVYGIFYRVTDVSGLSPSETVAAADVVVVRSDEWAAEATPFAALTDPSDGLAGRLVATGLTVPAFGPVLGQNRLTASNLSIAVDPQTSDRVWIAWADRVGMTGYTLHVRRSEHRGVDWSPDDLLTIDHATNPALAVSSRGKVGFLYQQLTGPAGSQRWQTHFRRSVDGTSWTDDVLADTPADTPAAENEMDVGDYLHLQAVGKDFYGIFSANNAPVLANFPSGVTYQRNADWTTGTLLPDSGPGAVDVSIDPFFFKVIDTAPDQDFYVRDWTDGTGADAGLEPSTHPYFFTTSDVWNQLSDTVPTFNADDQPVASNVRNGVGALGDNFAFARVHRKGAGSAADVSLHFLYANFGVGLNYQDAGTAVDPTLTFPAASTQQTLSAGYPWHLDPTTSEHLCLGVEITAPNDPFVLPSLWGSSPGWPYTDLRVINDNNKAQRNIQILPTASALTGSGTSAAVSGYAIVHNAATFPRTVVVRYEAAPEVVKKLGGARVEVVGQRARPFRSGDTIRLEGMQPGENRWLRITFEAPSGRQGEILPVYFREMVGNAAVNGFALVALPSRLEDVLRHNLEMHRAVFTRMAALTGNETAAGESRAATALLERGEISEQSYRDFLREHGRPLADGLDSARKHTGWKASFYDRRQARRLGRMRNVSRAAAAHTAALNELDALLTVRQLAAGDPADILQNVRWQRDLYHRMGPVPGAEVVLRKSEEFISGYTRRDLGNADYSGFVRGLLGSYRETALALRSPELGTAVAGMEQRNAGSLAALQKAHRSFLLVLQGLPGAHPILP